MPRCEKCKFFNPDIPEVSSVAIWRGVCRIELPRWLFTTLGIDSYSLNTSMRAEDGCDLGEEK